MTKNEIERERRLSTSRVRRDVEKTYIYETEEVTRKSHKRKYLTVVVSDSPRHVLRRPR